MSATDTPMPPHPLHERVDLIIHLLKFSDRLFAIMSSATDELHTFADLLIKQAGVGLLIAHVRPHPTLSAEDVASDLAKAWGIELALGESAMQALEQRLPERLPEPRRAVAIIEDVDHLPSQTLDELIGFMQRLDEQTGGRVRLVLLGGSNLADQLRQMQSLEAGGQVYALHLSPPPVEAFADMATSVLDDTPPAFEHFTPRSSAASALPGRTLLIGGIAASLTLAVIIAMLMRPGEPETMKDQQVSIPLKSETIPSLPVAPLPPPPSGAVTGEPVAPAAPTPMGQQAAPSSTGAGGANAPMLAAPTSTSRPTPLPPAEGKPSTSAPMGQQAAPSSTGAGGTNAPMLAAPTSTPRPNPLPPAEGKPSAPASTVGPKPSAPATVSTAEPKPSPAAPKPAAQPTEKATNWYAQQKGEQYVLQVISLRSEAEMERFIKQNGLNDCHSFRQLRDGQTLHTLTCGLYPSRDAASQASARLPANVQAGKPFPRRIDDIRKVMQP
ncbi:MAG: SPOR domain-containing protein [Halothiobacillaceae bacterium]